MPLTDTAIRGIKPADKARKFFDGNGLFLYVAPSGTKSWRVKYRFQGREKLLTLGVECQYVVPAPGSREAGGFLPRAVCGRWKLYRYVHRGKS